MQIGAIDVFMASEMLQLTYSVLMSGVIGYNVERRGNWVIGHERSSAGLCEFSGITGLLVKV